MDDGRLLAGEVINIKKEKAFNDSVETSMKVCKELLNSGDVEIAYKANDKINQLNKVKNSSSDYDSKLKVAMLLETSINELKNNHQETVSLKK